MQCVTERVWAKIDENRRARAGAETKSESGNASEGEARAATGYACACGDIDMYNDEGRDMRNDRVMHVQRYGYTPISHMCPYVHMPISHMCPYVPMSPALRYGAHEMWKRCGYTAATHCCDTLLQHTAATHCCNTLLQHTAATHCCNTAAAHCEHMMYGRDMDICNDSVCMSGDMEVYNDSAHTETWIHATTLVHTCNDSICMRLWPCSASKCPCGDFAYHICKKRPTYPQKSPKSMSKSHYPLALLHIQVSTRIFSCLHAQQGDLTHSRETWMRSGERIVGF